MKNNLYPQFGALNGSFDDYDSVIGNEFSVDSTSAKNSGGDGGNSNYSDGMSSLGNSHLGLNSAANSPIRMNISSAAAASANPQTWREQQRTPMTPMSDESSDSNALEVGDVSVVLGNTGKTPGIGDIESVGGDSLFMMSPPVRQTSSHLATDAAEWNPKAGTSQYLQLGPKGNELLFGDKADKAAYDNYPTFNNELDLNADVYSDEDDEEDDDDATIGFLPQGRLGNCIMISSTLLVVGALVISVVAILNLTSVLNNQNDNSKLNIDAAGGGVNDVITVTLAPSVPISTIAPTVPQTTISPTSEPTVLTDSPTATPTAEPTIVTVSPTAPIALVLNETESPVSPNISTLAPTKEPTTDTPTNGPTVTTPSPTSSAPTKEPTTDTPTNGPTVTTLSPTSSVPTQDPTTDEESTTAPSKGPTTIKVEIGALETPLPSKAPTTEEPTLSFQPTLSPTEQTLLTVGAGAFNKQDIHFYLVSDALYVRQYWKNKFEKLGNNRSRFLFHLGSATPASEDCPEEAYYRTAKSLSFSPLRAFAVPGNNDYPDCLDPSLAWKNYTEHLVNIDKKYWTSTSRFQIKRDPGRPENFAFIFRRTLFVGLNMVSNEDETKTAARLEHNLQWVDDNVEPHAGGIDVIFLMGHGRLRDLPTFRDAIVKKTKDEWKNKLIVYARRANQSNLFVNVEGAKNFHELTVGVGYPLTGIHLDIISKNAPRVGYRYIDGSPINKMV